MPKPDPAKFFADQQGGAVLKHAVLGRQLKPWGSKLGSRAKDHHIGYVDTHAGAGAYEDGSPGSPLIAAQVSHDLEPYPRKFECFYVEPDPLIAGRLREALKTIEHPCEVFERPIEMCLDEILERAGSMPLFIFSDPFGLGLSAATIRNKVMQRPGKTDIMINFSLSALWHCAGQLNNKATDAKKVAAREKALASLDEAVGGPWWRDIWDAPHATTQVRDRAIVIEYMTRLAGGTWQWAAIPVPDRLGGSPAYYLLFLTQHEDGMWLIANNLSKALEEFEQWCAARERLDADQMQLELDWHGVADDREDRMIDHIARNVDELLKAQPEITIGRALPKVLGEMFGRARETHIRKALKRLHERGAISTAPKGDLQHFRVRR